MGCGLKMGAIFTASAQHWEQLCSPSSASEPVIRRLKTDLVSLSKSFTQVVELRVMSPTDHEIQKERKLLLGVSLMGERTPFLQEQPVHSLIIEQHLDEIGQLRVAGNQLQAGGIALEQEQADCFSEIGLTLSDKSLRRRRGSHKSHKSASKASMAEQQGQHRCTFPPPWRKAFSHDYLKECSLSNLENLVCSWNHVHNGCCNWHAALDQLAELVTQMRRWHMCHERWPTSTPLWQCSECSALQFSAEDDFCSLCFAAKA